MAKEKQKVQVMHESEYVTVADYVTFNFHDEEVVMNIGDMIDIIKQVMETNRSFTRKITKYVEKNNK